MSTTRELSRYRPTPSMIVALLALMIACSTGAYAATVLPKNSVTSKSIKNGQVKSADIKNGQVKAKDLKQNAVKAKQLADNAVDAAALADGSVDSSAIADGQVGGAEIGDGQVGGADIGDGQVGAPELAPTLRTDLDDASTLGGLTVAQIVAAAGGEYFEATQTAASTDIEKVAPTDLVTLELPKAGKYLINARIPVKCTYDGSDGASPANPAPNQPYFYARGQLMLDGTQVASEVASCEAEAVFAVVLVGVFQGTAMVDITHQVTTTGPATLKLRGLSAPSVVLGTEVVAGNRINATASGSQIQAITVQ